jgi:hypothetical protein
MFAVDEQVGVSLFQECPTPRALLCKAPGRIFFIFFFLPMTLNRIPLGIMGKK